MSILDCMLETASALGTVGLSFGLTEHLDIGSQFVLILLMFFGRVGALTMIYAMHAQPQGYLLRQPEERITVG